MSLCGKPFLLLCCLLAQYLNCVSPEPACEDTTHRHATVKEFTCSNFTSADDFEKYFKHDEDYADLWFVLKDSNIDYLPPGVLAGTRASLLEFNNVKLKSFTAPDSNATAFAGLENSVRRIAFTHKSSVPSSWEMLKPLTKLEELVFFEMSLLNLTRDFNKLPKTLKKVVIIRSTIGFVDEDWMASLPNLENVRIQSSTLDRFSRKMLPRPAKHLRKLTIGDSSLTSLPKDFGADFPAMIQVNLRQNLINTFEKASLSPLNNNKTVVVLSGNPVQCDCKISFLLDFPETWVYPQCSSPESLAGTFLRNVTTEQLNCENDGRLSRADP
ncbi:toll-like receptor 9 [Ixodes scapularis]|uniref:toll-like receptor 9 n=1 Tax=Ixodes scapularis TaxID=6945 RepID=UPI001A9E8C96|nr:toll-like receptor 9 [Ixodes scapularis]